jgi:hypothetical protein
VVEGAFSTLAEYLRSYGVANKDVDELKEAIDTDKNVGGKVAFGKHVQAWLSEMVGKAASGTWKISTSVATAMLGKALAKYFGLE